MRDLLSAGGCLSVQFVLVDSRCRIAVIVPRFVACVAFIDTRFTDARLYLDLFVGRQPDGHLAPCNEW